MQNAIVFIVYNTRFYTHKYLPTHIKQIVKEIAYIATDKYTIYVIHIVQYHRIKRKMFQGGR